MIGEALTLTTPYGSDSAVIIIKTARLTEIVAEIELGKITVQMLLAAMLIHAAHSAFED